MALTQTDQVLFEAVARLGDEIEAHRLAMRECAAQRAAIVRELNKRHGYEGIGRRLGITKARVQQIVHYERGGLT